MNKPYYKQLYFFVILAMIAGIVFGVANPENAKHMKICSDLFIRIIKMIVSPVIFLTVTIGIAHLKDFKKAGRIGLKTIFYFELITTLALIIGLLVVNIIKPGAGLNKNQSAIDATQIAGYVKKDASPLIYKIVPSNIIQPFIEGEILQILFLAILTGIAISSLQYLGIKILEGLDLISRVFFKMVSYLMIFAPIGAFGAMAFTVGNYGISSLLQLGKLMLCVYITCFAFIFIVLGAVAKMSGFSIINFIKFIKHEILIVLGTSSSESVLPRMIEKMEKLGCSKTVSRLVIPTGYSFNLDGTSIYLTMAALFIAQAMNINLSIGDQLILVGILMLTSKGAAAVTGGGLITLAATLNTVDTIPLAGIALLIGVDRFMSEARAITNLIGNGVATLVISNWEKETNLETLHKELENSASQ